MHLRVNNVARIAPTPPADIRLSICIPTYNFGAFIGETLESILPQVVEGVEVVILDGGSTDETPEVVRGFQERFPELRYERRAERGGIDRDLARTVDLARGEYCWLFCSDDVMKPGAVDRMLGHIRSELDIYVCGFTLCTRDMRRIADQRIVDVASDSVFDLGLAEDRRRYFERAQTSPAFFSFAGSLIVKKARWDSREIDEAFVGSCWAHVARLFAMIPGGLRLGYLATSYLDKRTDNDSFMDSGLVRRYALSIDGYHRLAQTFFGEESLEARHVRRVVANELPPWVLLHAKSEARREHREDLPMLDRLAAKAYADPSPGNRLKHLAYRLTPLFAYRCARASYRVLKPVRGASPKARTGNLASLRILVFNPSYPPVRCGVGDYTRGLAHVLTAAGNDVTVVTAERATPPAAGPPRVLPLLRNWDVGGFVRQAWPRVRRPRPDVVVSCFPAVVQSSRSRLLYLLPGLAKGLLGRPRTVFILHEYVRISESHRRWLPLALHAADRIVAVTEAEREAVVAAHPRLASKIVVCHNPPNIPIAPDDPAADAALRAALGPADRPLLAYFGFIWDPKKGFEELLAALSHTDAELVVTGSLDPENAYHAHIASEIERLELEDRVRWLGFLEEAEIGRLLRAADAVVLPFRGGAESSFTSLLAAIVNGAVVITTQGPRNPPWLRDGETAALIPEPDPEAIAAAIGRLASDAALAARVRAGARAVSLGWDDIVEAVTGERRQSRTNAP